MANTLDWPDEFDRTDPSARQPYPHNFEVSVHQAIDNIKEELDRFDADTTRVATAAEGLTDSSTRIEYEDPGIVAYWRFGDEDFAAPCDRWDNLRDNAQAVYHYLSAKRGMERWGVETVEGEFSTQRRSKRLVDR